jgi:hypothetical protein
LPTVRYQASPWPECRGRLGFPYEAVMHDQEAEQHNSGPPGPPARLLVVTMLTLIEGLLDLGERVKQHRYRTVRVGLQEAAKILDHESVPRPQDLFVIGYPIRDRVLSNLNDARAIVAEAQQILASARPFELCLAAVTAEIGPWPPRTAQCRPPPPRSATRCGPRSGSGPARRRSGRRSWTGPGPLTR